MCFTVFLPWTHLIHAGLLASEGFKMLGVKKPLQLTEGKDSKLVGLPE